MKKNLDLNDDWKTFPDPSVYKSTQLFRLSESTKDFDYYRPAKLLKEFVVNGEKIKFQWELECSFVGLYTGDKHTATLLPSFDTKVEKIIEPKELNESGTTTREPHNCTVERFNCSLEDIEQILNNIGNDGNGVHFDIYLKIGMGLHHFFEGEVEGLKLWKNWCKRSAKYNEAQTEKDYDSFSFDVEVPITISILALAKEENPNFLFDFLLMKKECYSCFPRDSSSTRLYGNF